MKKILQVCLILLVTCNSLFATTPAEKNALVALYNSTDGANWTKNDNWLKGDPCVDKWYSVTCVYGSVTKISLYSNNLTGVIPTEIGNLTNLTNLSLNSNNLTGQVPLSITKLVNIKSPYKTSSYLNLSNNHLLNSNDTIETFLNQKHKGKSKGFYNTQLIPTTQAEKDALIALHYNTNGSNWSYSINWLTGDPCINKWFGITCKNGDVIKLKLYANKLTGTLPLEIGNLTNLKNLSLPDNNLTGDIPVEIGNLANLTWLDLSNNQLASALPSEIGNLANLTGLILTDSQLTGALPIEIGNLINLRYLYLHNNHLQNFDGTIEAFLNNKHDGGSTEFYNTQTTSKRSLQ